MSADLHAVVPVPQVKCVVWDLDGTLWDGALVESTDVTLRPGVPELFAELDRRGVLQSVATKNDAGVALPVLERLGLAEYLLYPQASWEPKSDAIRTIAGELNISPSAVLFVDDDPFECAEVASELPAVRCVDAAQVPGLLDRPDVPAAAAVSREASGRRQLYRQEEQRCRSESTFRGSKSEFLASLRMRLTVHTSGHDLDRAAELTARTNQLNTTGLTFSHEELCALAGSADHEVLTVELSDCFGEYGVIGVVVVRVLPAKGESRIRLFLLSCRVMGRSVAPALIALLARRADERGLWLTADFRPTDVNRPMYVVYRFSGFVEQTPAGGDRCLLLSSSASRHTPAYFDLHVQD